MFQFSWRKRSSRLLYCREGGYAHVLTHSAIAEKVYHSCPEQLRVFLHLSDLELHYFSHLPDEVDQDNILVTGGCALEEAWSHSYKLQWDRDQDVMTPLGGSAIEVVTQVPRLARNAAKEGKFDEAREHLARAMHVATDLATIWHLTRELTSDQHSSGEAAIAKNARKLLPDTVTPLPMTKRRSLYWSLRDWAEETVRDQLDRVKKAQDEGTFDRDLALQKEMVTRAASQTLAVINYGWQVVQGAWR